MKLCPASIHLKALFKASSFDAALCICLTLLCSALEYSNTRDKTSAVTDSINSLQGFVSSGSKQVPRSTLTVCAPSPNPPGFSAALLEWLLGLWWPPDHGVESSCASAVDPAGV